MGHGRGSILPLFRCASLPTAAVANRLPTPHQRGHRSSNEQRRTLKTCPAPSGANFLRRMVHFITSAGCLNYPYRTPILAMTTDTRHLMLSLDRLSIDILAGFAGRTSLGHGAIFGVSTYAVVYTSAQAGFPPIVAFVLGVLAATAVAAIFALLAVRTSGVYFLLLTLALGSRQSCRARWQCR
jgi:hypothetical protein